MIEGLIQSLVFILGVKIMRKRKWVLVLTSVVTLMIVTAYFSWRLSRANEKVKQLLLEKIHPFLDQSSDIEKLDFNISSLNIKGVRLTPKDRSFSLEVENIRIGYRFWNLFKYGFSPHKVAHQIVLIHPVIVFRHVESIASSQNGSGGIEKLIEMTSILKTVKKITVAGAEILFEGDLDHNIRLAYDLNGWLHTNPSDSAIIRLSGKLFSSKEKNLKVSGKLNLNSGQPVFLKAKIDDSEPSPEIPLLIPDFMEVTKGRMRGEGSYNKEQGVQGFIEIRNSSFSFKNEALFFEDVSLVGNLIGRNLLLKGEIERFNGSYVELEGNIENILKPHLNVNLQCPNFNIPKFVSSFNPTFQTPISDHSQFHFHITGSLSNPIMEGSFKAKGFQIYGNYFHQLNSNVGLQDSIFSITGVAERNDGLTMNLEGRMKLFESAQSTQVKLVVKGNLKSKFPKWIKKSILRCEGDFGIGLTGPLMNLTGETFGHLTLVNIEGNEIRLNPVFYYDQQTLHGEIRSNQNFKLWGEIKNPFKQTVTWNIQCVDIESIIHLLFNKHLPWSANDFHVSAQFSGSLSKWVFNNQVTDASKDQEKEICLVNLNSEKVNQSGSFKRKISLNGLVYNREREQIELNGQVDLNKNAIIIRNFKLGEIFSCEGIYPSKSEDILRGWVRINKLNLNWLDNLLSSSKSMNGQLNAKIQIDGTRQQPDITIHGQLKDGLFHSTGIFEGEFDGRIMGRSIEKLQCFIYKNDVPYMEGFINKTIGDSIKGHITGHNIDYAELLKAMLGKENVVCGKGLFKFDIHGLSTHPILSGTMKIQKGHIGRFSFRQFQCDLIDTIHVGNNLSEGSLYILNGYLEREDNLNINIWGTVPHHHEKDWDMSLSGEGNVLGPLPTFSDLVKAVKSSSGHFFIRIGGRPGDWIMGDGRILISDGEIMFSSALDRIERIQGNMVLNQANRFLHIQNISGYIDGGKFTFYNSWDNNREGRFEPLLLENLGVHLGIIHFLTDSRGIPVHIPGLMEIGDFGRIEFRGETSDETFMISGPVESPILTGILYLSDTRLTYPMLPIKESIDSESLMKLLKNIEWNLDVIPKKDVHYIREIDSPFGNVYADLQLQNGFEGLHFNGVIQNKDFQVWGMLTSTEGTIDVLDHYFRPERIIFDYPKGGRSPIVTGRAFTTVIDSVGIPSTVWLSLTTQDPMTGLETEGGSWEVIRFRFYTDNPNLGRTEADLMAGLGYAATDMRQIAYDALGIQVENRLFRPIFKPIERELRRHLGLDMFRVSSMLSRNFFDLQSNEITKFDARWLLQRTKLTVGKYLAPGFFLTYSGQIQNEIGLRYNLHGIGFRHALTMEYSIRPDLFLEMEYSYDSQLISDRREDTRIWLRHIFPF